MSFSSDIKKFNDKFEKKATRVFRGSALEIFKAVILRTSVDTGRLRANWFSSINTSQSRTVEENDKSGGKAIGYARQTTSVAKLGDSIYLVNNLPYAELIENGRSDQSPAGMVGITVLEWRAKVDAKTKGIL